MPYDVIETHPFWPANWQYAFIDLIAIIGKKAADLFAGSGVVFDTQDDTIQEYLDHWAEKEHLNLKLWKYEYNQSTIGRGHFWLVKNEDESYSVIENEVMSSIRVSIFNEDEVAAQIFTAQNQGDRGHYFQYDFTKGKITKTEWIDSSQAQVGSVITEVPPSAIIKKKTTFKTELNIVPIMETTNIPKPNYYTYNTWYFHPDWEPALRLMLDEQAIFQQKIKERELNHTYMNGVFTPEFLKVLQSTNNNLWKAVKQGILASNGISYSQGEDNAINITYGDPKLETYNNDILWTEIQIYHACGYNHPREGGQNTGDYTNKTQTLMNGILDEQTTRLKQKYIGDKFMAKIIDPMLIDLGLWNGLGSRPYNMRFLSNTIADMVMKNNILDMRLKNGTISRIDYIQQMDNVNQRMAEDMIDEIDADNLTMMEQQLTVADNSDNNPNEPAGDQTKEVVG